MLRGTLTAWDGANHLATVRLDGSSFGEVGGIRVTRALDGAEMVPGRRVIINPGSGGSATELVVIAVYVA